MYWYNRHIGSKKETKEEVTKMLKTVGVVRERKRERRNTRTSRAS